MNEDKYDFWEGNIPIEEKDKSRFWENVDKLGSNDCWNWKASCRTGYGTMRINGVQRTMHRFSVLLDGRPIPKGKIVMHTCDNRKCVNPNHLIVGTYSDNLNDAISKGIKRGKIGEESTQSKLTADIIISLRLQNAVHPISFRAMSRRLGVSKDLVRRAVKGETWKHVK